MKIVLSDNLCYTFLKRRLSEGANNMKKLRQSQKVWLESYARKIVYLRMKRNKRNKRNLHKSPGHWNRQTNSKINGKCTMIAPSSLSLTDNLDSTLIFFNAVIAAIRKCSVNGKIYFDLSQVDNLTYDAIMYLIALISNMRRVRMYKVHFSGNEPINKQAREVLDKSGFYRFVTSQTPKPIKSDSEHIQITSGTHTDSPLVGQLCAFASGGLDALTKRLFPMLIELMTNTYQHAYKNEDGIMKGNWYIFAENITGKTKFLFLDTGVGIPATISKKFLEHISLVKKDASLIASALRGDELRSETKLKHRGQGLPQIYKDCYMGTIQNMLIISGYGQCRIGSNGQIEEVTLNEQFRGTLFSWEFSQSARGGE